MRGRRRTVASLLTDTLSGHSGARAAAAAAAFAEVCGFPICRGATARGFTADGRLQVFVRSTDWARELEALAPAICARMNARLGSHRIGGLAVRVGSASCQRTE